MKRITCFIFLLISLSLQAVIPQNDSATTAKAAEALELAFRQRVFEEYKADSKETDETKVLVEKLNKTHWLGIRRQANFDQGSYEKLWKQVDQAKPKHAFTLALLAHSGMQQMKIRSQKQVVSRINQAFNLVKGKQKPSLVGMWVALLKLQSIQMNNNNPSINERNMLVKKLCVDVFFRGLSLCKTAQQRRPFYSTLTLFMEGLPCNLKLYLHNSVRAKKNIDAWLQLAIAGRYHYKRAWARRGGGYSNSVRSEAHWRDFKLHLQQARQAFSAAWELDKSIPEMANKMIPIALEDGSEEERQWFDRAVSAQFDFAPAYYNYFRTLQPRWGGSKKAIIDFGRECLQTKRFETSVPMEFYSAIIRVKAESGGRQDFIKEMALYKECFGLLRSMSTQKVWQFTGTPYSSSWCRSLATALALQQGEIDDAIEMLELEAALNVKAFQHFNLNMDLEVSYAFAYTYSGPAAGFLGQLRSDVTDTKLKSLEKLAELQAQLEEAKQFCSNKRGLPFYTWAKRILTQQQSFHKGDWVDLKFSPNLTQFTKTGKGNWSYVSPDTVELILNQGTSRLYLKNTHLFAGPIEIEVDVDEVEVSSPYNYMQAGIVCGDMRNSRYREPAGMMFYVNSRRRSFGALDSTEGAKWQRANVPRKNTLNVKCWPSYSEYQVGGYHSREYNDNFKLGPIGIGSFLRGAYSGKVRFSKLRLRRLSQAAAPKDLKFESEQAKKAYYENRLKHDPKSLFCTLQLSFQYDDSTEGKSNKRKALQSYLDLGGKGFAWLCYVEFAGAAWNDDKYGESITLYKKSLKMQKNEYAHSGLAYAYSHSNEVKLRNGKEALKNAQRALKINSKTANYYYILAAAHAELKQFAKAKAALQKARKQPDFKDYKERIDKAQKSFDAGKALYAEFSKKTQEKSK